MKATDDEGYSNLWWTGRSGVRRRTVDWVGALGRGGQSIRIGHLIELPLSDCAAIDALTSAIP